MPKRKSKLSTKKRTFYVPKNDLVDEWFGNQDTSGGSINVGIILKIEEYGIKDYSMAIAQRYASADHKKKKIIGVNDKSSMPKVKKKSLRTAVLYNEGPVLDWINAQSSLSSSLSLLIIDLIAQFGTDDLPSALAWLNGRQNKYLNENIITNRPTNNEEQKQVELKSLSSKEESNSSLGSLVTSESITSKKDSQNNDSLLPTGKNEDKIQDSDDDLDLSILHDKSFLK